MKGAVSVIIPCYEQAHFLPDAIESALGQTHRKVEVIVVDDGSPDTTAEVVTRYPGVRCVRQENRGVAEARNAGFRASGGEYVLFLDADDRLTPNAVEAHLLCFAEHPEAGFVVGDIDQIAGDGSYIYSPRWPVLESNFYEELLKVNHVANTMGIMFRRSLVDALGGFASAFEPAEDYRNSAPCRPNKSKRASFDSSRSVSPPCREHVSERSADVASHPSSDGGAVAYVEWESTPNGSMAQR